MTRSKLDPNTAYVSFSYEDLGGNFGRVYYWYDPDVKGSTIDDWEFRAQHAEIGAAEWDQLFYHAFDRGATDFERLFDGDASTNSVLSCMRLFGPQKPDPPNAQGRSLVRCVECGVRGGLHLAACSARSRAPETA
jgi:hypothetical protein